MRRTFAPEPLQLKVIDMNVGREATGLVTAIYFAGLAFSPASAQDSKDRAIEQYTCKDIMRESGASRDVAIAFLRGFLLGKSGTTKFNLDVLHKQSDEFIERCLTNPGEKATPEYSEELKFTGERMINMLRNCLLLATLVLGAMFSEHAAAQNWTQVGTLSCRDDPNIGFIIIGHQPMQCVYSQAPGAVPQMPPQSYDGALSTIGVALAVSTGSVLGWAVFTPTTGVPAGALAGEYVGVSADVGLGLGAGANVLLGGSNRTIALQPLSLQGHGDQRDRRRIVTQAPLALDG